MDDAESKNGMILGSECQNTSSVLLPTYVGAGHLAISTKVTAHLANQSEES